MDEPLERANACEALAKGDGQQEGEPDGLRFRIGAELSSYV